MASNSTSTITGVLQSTPTQAPTTPAASPSTPQPQTSPSSTANTAPTSAPISEPQRPSTPTIVPTTSENPIPSSPAPPPPPTTTPSTPATTISTPTSAPPPPPPSSAAPTAQPTTTSPASIPPTVSTITSTNPQGSTVTIISTSTQTPTEGDRSFSSTSSSASSAATADTQKPGEGSSGGGLSSSGTIAIAVVVPIAAVALLILAGLFFWRKRKARKDAEELRRKEVEEYGYNPNNDPALPAAGGSAGHDGSYEMREDGSAGYRGWGTTAVASSGRKASTTISGGQSAGGIGMAYSEEASPTYGPQSDARSDNLLMDGRATSPEAEALGAMGPAASANRADINRGPSNASSSYSAAGRSDGSGEVMASGGQYYNNQYDTGNPYSGEAQYGSPPGRAEMPAQPVIRDVQARRNTRIENPSHFPQQSAGISQNF